MRPNVPFDRHFRVVLLTAGCALAQNSSTGVLNPGRSEANRASAHAWNSPSDSRARARAAESYGKLPLSFEANQGQTDPLVRFLARGSGYTLSLTSNEAVLALRGSSHAGNLSVASGSTTVAMRIVGANPKASISGLEELEAKSNYFIGNDPKKWRTQVPNYAKVRYQEVYPGVDLVYYGNQGQLEYDFVVAPGGDFEAIRLAFLEAGRDSDSIPPLRIDHNGDLILGLGGDELRFHKPTAYQLETDHKHSSAGGDNRSFVEAGYILKSNGQVAIRLGPYDTTKDLVIDPVLAYSSYIGGSSIDTADGIAVDSAGNAYITGLTESSDFPRVNQIPGACLGTCGSFFPLDAFVTKINAEGTALIYSSYLGGSGLDQGNGIAVDSSGNAYVTGSTASADFPRVNQIPGACVGTCGTGSFLTNAFVTEINAAGNALVYSSVVGGSIGDISNGIAVDGSGNAYLAGFTESTDFPQVNPIPGACQGTCGTVAFSDVAFVTKISAGGSALIYSSYLGGSSFFNRALGIAVDGSSNAYVTGTTSSADFPRVNQIPGACIGTCGTGTFSDSFVTKITAAGALGYSSLLGGSSFDGANAIAADSVGNVYLTGFTQSTDFPQVGKTPVPRICNGTCGNGGQDAFVTKINSAGNALVYSTYLGGSGSDMGQAIAVDGFGNAYVAGVTESANFPDFMAIKGACQGICGRGGFPPDAFVTEINAEGRMLVFSSLIGGSGSDQALGIAVDGSGNAYLTGQTDSGNFPQVNTIPGACQGSCGTAGNGDAFVLKIPASSK